MDFSRFWVYTAFHNNVQNYAITELRHKRVSGCRKNVRISERFFDNHYKIGGRALMMPD